MIAGIDFATQENIPCITLSSSLGLKKHFKSRDEAITAIQNKEHLTECWKRIQRFKGVIFVASGNILYDLDSHKTIQEHPSAYMFPQDFAHNYS